MRNPRRKRPAQPPHSEPDLTESEREELDRYVIEFAADWDARERRFRTTFGLMFEAGRISAEERNTRLDEIHEMRLEHERDHRQAMIDAIRMTDEDWEAIKADDEFQSNLAQVKEMATALAAGIADLDLNPDFEDPVANLVVRNLAGSVERVSNAVERAVRAASDGRQSESGD